MCDPVEPPPQTCELIRNTDKCGDVTEFVNPTEGCDCYNFCDGKLTGCCKFGEACGATCQSESASDDLVAGCPIDPNKPPVSPPPGSPTSSPTEASPSCPIRKNTENCQTLLERYPPGEDCDCYNYCGNVFVGCCPFDADCSVSCTLQLGEEATAGCSKLSDVPGNEPQTTTSPIETPITAFESQVPTAQDANSESGIPASSSPAQSPATVPTEIPVPPDPTQQPTPEPAMAVNPATSPSQAPTAKDDVSESRQPTTPPTAATTSATSEVDENPSEATALNRFTFLNFFGLLFPVICSYFL
jgi:hypothetical protein